MPVASALFHAEAALVSLAVKHRLPTSYENRAFAEAGGLMSYGPDVADISGAQRPSGQDLDGNEAR